MSSGEREPLAGDVEQANFLDVFFDLFAELFVEIAEFGCRNSISGLLHLLHLLQMLSKSMNAFGEALDLGALQDLAGFPAHERCFAQLSVS